MRSLSLGQTRLLFRLMAESEQAAEEADAKLRTAREAWERQVEPQTEDQKTRLAE